MCQPDSGCCINKGNEGCPSSPQSTAALPFGSPPSYDVSEANTILFLRGCMSWTIGFSPAVQPHPWFIINLICCGASVTVLLDVFLSMHKVRAQMMAEELFLVYNCTSTAIWCLQMILTVLERRVTAQCLTWPVRLEVCLALFFFYDSVQLISAWRVHDDEVARQDLMSALINTVAYLYISYEMWTREVQQSFDVKTIGIPFHKMESDGDATPKQTNHAEQP